MATRKDLLDAFTFSRRRMISNVLQPSATGTDESAPRPVRNFVGGITLAALLVLVFLLIGLFKGSGASATASVLLLDKDTGGRYVVEGGRAYPVANVASAKLMLGSGMSVQTVSDSAITKLGKTIGPAVGIPGLPDYLPGTGDLDLKTWTVCEQPAGSTSTDVNTVLGVGYGALTPLNSSTGLLVKDIQDNNTYYVLVDGTKYPIDPAYAPSGNNTGKVLDAFSFFNPNGVVADDNFLAAIPSGAPLTVPQVPDAGKALTVNGDGVFTTVGQYAKVEGANGVNSYFIMTDQGVMSVTPFEYALYTTGASQTLQVSNVTVGQISAMTSAPKSTTLLGVDSTWPTQLISISDGDPNNASVGDICATTGGGAVTLSTGNSLDFGGGGTSPQQGTAAEADTVYVEGGHGVIVAATGGGAAGKDFLVTDTGLRYQLDSSPVTTPGSSQQTVQTAQQQLGYDKVPVLALPSAWIALIQEGPDMNPGNAHETEQVAGEASTYVP